MAVQDALSLLEEAHVAREEDSKDAAIAKYRAFVEAYRDTSESDLHAALVEAWGWIGCLSDDGEEALAACAECVEAFGSSNDPELRRDVDIARYNRAYMLWQMARYDEAIAAFDELIDLYRARPESADIDLWSDALLKKASSLSELGRSAEARPLYTEVVERFRDAMDPGVRLKVAETMVWTAKLLGESGEREAAIRMADETMTRFGEAPDPLLRKEVALALSEKGRQLELLGKHNDALALYRTGLRRFADLDDVPAAADALAWLRARVTVLTQR